LLKNIAAIASLVPIKIKAARLPKTLLPPLHRQSHWYHRTLNEAVACAASRMKSSRCTTAPSPAAATFFSGVCAFSNSHPQAFGTPTPVGEQAKHS
jgi:hypothetical protein